MEINLHELQECLFAHGCLTMPDHARECLCQRWESQSTLRGNLVWGGALNVACTRPHGCTKGYSMRIMLTKYTFGMGWVLFYLVSYINK